MSQDVSSKNYVDRNTITAVGGVEPSDTNMSIGSDRVRSLSCTAVIPGKGFVLMLGNFSNSLEYTVAEPTKKPFPVLLNTEERLTSVK